MSTDCPNTSGGEPRTVLLVDDAEAVRWLAGRALQRLGHRVLEASDGNEAMRLIKEADAVHLLLTDVIMPRMSGQELAEAVWTHHPAMPVIFMSGHGHVVPASAARTAFILKPFSPSDLASRVRELVG